MTEEQLIRAAVLDVIDGGCQRHKTKNYLLWNSDEAMANQERLDFCDAIIARIKQLRQMDGTAEANHPR